MTDIFINKGDAPSRFHVYNDIPLPIPDGSVTSIEMAVWLVLLFQHALMKLYGELLNSKRFRLEPTAIQPWLESQGFVMIPEWAVMVHEVIRSIIRYQLTKKGEFFNSVTGLASKLGSTVYFCTNDRDLIWSTGCKGSMILRAKELKYKRIFTGFHHYGEIIASAIDSIRSGTRFNSKWDLHYLLSSIVIEQPKFTKTMLILADSQFRHLQGLYGAVVISIGGGTLVRLVTECRRRMEMGEFQLGDFMYIAVALGINDCQRKEYIRDRGIKDIFNLLKPELERRKPTRPFVLLSPPFPLGGIKTGQFTTDLWELFEGTATYIVDWENEGNPFEEDGRQVQRFFERPDYFHLSLQGLTELFRVWSGYLQEISYLKMIQVPDRNPAQTNTPSVSRKRKYHDY